MSKNITNRDVNQYVNRRQVFCTGNKTMYAEIRDNLYVVYSYGAHFPMYVYDINAREWFGNEGRYSVTTSRHQSHARPDADITWADTDYLRAMIIAGGYASQVAQRMRGHELSTATAYA